MKEISGWIHFIFIQILRRITNRKKPGTSLGNLRVFLLLAVGFFAGNAPVFSQYPGYSLVWEDSFDGPQINGAVWNVEYNHDYIPNGELQAYLPQNVSVGKAPVSGESCLILTAKKENHRARKITSGRVNTAGKYNFQYGIVEARIKIPKTANGLWPAFWLLGADEKVVGWPWCGEIDIMEMGIEAAYKDNSQERANIGSIHWGSFAAGNHSMLSLRSSNNYSLQNNEFHLFTMIWDADKIEMYLDRDKFPFAKPYFSFSINQSLDGFYLGDFFRKPFYIIFNLAAGGVFPNIYNAEQISALSRGNNYEARMYVDYVRVYQKTDTRPVVCLGDSITEGYNFGANPEADYKAFPLILQSRLTVPVINAGKIGDTCQAALNRLFKDVLPYNPQAVVVFLGINDIVNNVNFYLTRINLVTILNYVSAPGRKVFIVKFLPDYIIRDMLASHGKTKDEQDYLVNQYNALYLFLKQTYGAEIIDNVWDGIIPALTIDGIHPTAEGQRIIGEHIFNALQPYLAREIVIPRR